MCRNILSTTLWENTIKLYPHLQLHDRYGFGRLSLHKLCLKVCERDECLKHFFVLTFVLTFLNEQTLYIIRQACLLVNFLCVTV